MSSEFLEVFSFIINTGYAFLTSFNIPGVNFTPLAALFFASFFTVIFKAFRSFVHHPMRVPSMKAAPKSE